MSEENPSDALESALIRHARDYRASDRARAQTYAALGLVATPASFWKVHGLKVFLVVSTSLAVLGAAVLRVRSPDPVVAQRAAVAGPIAQPPPTATHETYGTPIAPVLDAPAVDPPIAITAAVRPATPVQRPKARELPVLSSAPTSTLGDEIAAIDRVRQAVYAKNKNAALVGLDDYDRRFPNGKLAPEAQVLRARASALP